MPTLCRGVDPGSEDDVDINSGEPHHLYPSSPFPLLISSSLWGPHYAVVHCPLQTCRKTVATNSRLQKHYKKKHGISLPDDGSTGYPQTPKRGQKRDANERGASKRSKVKKARQSRPAKAAGDITSSVFDVVNLRTPSPTPPRKSLTTIQVQPNTTSPIPFSLAMSPDSTSSSPERDILQTPGNGLPPVVRVNAARPTWVVETPSPTPLEGFKRAKYPGVSRALDNQSCVSEEEAGVSPFDRLGKTFGSRHTSESGVDQLASGIESGVEEDQGDDAALEDGEEEDGEKAHDGDREGTPSPTPRSRDMAVSVARRRSPVLGPAFDMFLPEYQAARRMAAREKRRPATPSEEDEEIEIGDAGKKTTVKPSYTLEHENRLKSPQTPITPTKPSLKAMPLWNSADTPHSTPSCSSTKVVEDILGSTSVSSHYPQHRHTLCPCMMLDIIARLASSYQCHACEGCRGRAVAHSSAKEAHN